MTHKVIKKSACFHVIPKGVILLTLLLLTACASPSDSSRSKTQDTILRLAETMPKDHPSACAMQYFAEIVDQETEGRVRVKIYYDGSLGTPREIIEQVKFGGIAMARVNVLELTEEVEPIRKFFEPSNFQNKDAQMEWIYEHEKTLRDECQMDRITPLVWYYPDFRCFYGTDTPFMDTGDLSGKRIESSESILMSGIFRNLDMELAGSVNINTYKSLISGNIDGAESSFSEFVCSNYDQYIRFVTKNDAWNLPDVMIINTENLTSLSKEDRETVEACAKRTYEYQKKYLEEFQQIWIETLIGEPEVNFSEGVFQ